MKSSLICPRQAYTNELELELAHLVAENEKLKKQYEEVIILSFLKQEALCQNTPPPFFLSIWRYKYTSFVCNAASFGNGCSALNKKEPEENLNCPILRKQASTNS